MQCVHAITIWASSQDMHEPWEPCKTHAPSQGPGGGAAHSRHHESTDEPDDEQDDGASDSTRKAGSVAGQQGRRKRTRTDTPVSSSSGCTLPEGNKASLPSSSVFQLSAMLLLLQQQWQLQKERQHMQLDLEASAAAFCYTDICGVVGEGASGHVFAARCA